jgi:hypothetical protein
VSADNREGAPPPSAADAGTPAAPDADDHASGVITSHGEREKRGYVAPIEVPKRHQRMKTMEMDKVRIAPDMKVAVPDSRHMPTTRMEVPPGGLRPPPPPQAEIGDPTSSPWTTTGGIDRSMLPSASLGPAVPAPSARPAAKAGDDEEGGRGLGIWIGVVIVAALLGGGAAYLLRGRVSSGGPPTVSSSAPIAITVSPTGNAVPPATAGEPGGAEPADTEDVEDIDDPQPGAAGTSTAVRPQTRTPRKTTTKATATSKTPAPTATPTATASTPKRLF